MSTVLEALEAVWLKTQWRSKKEEKNKINGTKK